jgi:hypothetical protein
LKAEKLALVIAIGNYPADSTWNKISINNTIAIDKFNKTRYFTLFNIPSNIGRIEVIPTKDFGYTPQEYSLKKNKTFTSVFHIEIKATGLQTLKLISSKKPLIFFEFALSAENDIAPLQVMLLNLHQQHRLKNDISSSADFKYIEAQTVCFETIE